ncbi:helix-turn-helix domain-containing protein [Actinokineospora sp. PR83]|uniref:helix-turn-helix domain-containing protein n=1 Tax=Actinokineospora sp. PR83 TaxID=2884908 RepID=UPI001F274C22|nr:helix-turn-helix domain-containing protein [Actinokineospora sp. PR83]MCG8915004.1 helix-turn-helix domain-containing protein [Actinokineospora sp. PR83]
MTDFGSELRRRRESAGMSLTSLAEAIHFTKGYLSKIENGRSRPTPALARACDRELGARGELSTLISEPVDGARWTGLPAPLAPTRHFVGRAAELSTLAAVLGRQDTVRVCVISGLAGVGKTALAVLAARTAEPDFPDGCLYADLRGHTPGAEEAGPGETAHRLLSLLGVDADRVPADAESRTGLLRGALRGRRVLLVLDNARTAAQVRPLLPDAPGCRVLVTSRGRLAALDDAWHLPLGVLARSEAIGLFRAVAGEGGPADDRAVARIVDRCDRLPLAVRIAAARFARGGWSAARFLDRLDRESSRLAALDDGERSVAAAFLVSHEGLPAEQRHLLGLLALHPEGTITTAAAEALAGAAVGDLDATIDRLHDTHLLTRAEDGDLTVHDLVRAFLLRHAPPSVEPGEQRAATSRLVDHALGTLVAADELLEPHRYRPPVDAPRPPSVPFLDADGALEWLRLHWRTLVGVTALAAGDRRCWQLAVVLRAFFFREKLFEPWISTHRVALETARAEDDQAATGMVLNHLGMAHVELGELDLAVDCHERAGAAFAAAGDRRGEVDALSSLAWVRLYQGDAEAAVRDLGIALGVYRRTGRTRNAVIALRGLALALTALDRFDEAREHAAEARESAQLPVDAVMGLTCQAWVSYRAGDLADARLRYTEAADLAELAGSRYERARALTGLGNTAARQGDPRGARDLWAFADELGVPVHPVVVGEGRARRGLSLENDPRPAEPIAAQHQQPPITVDTKE